jgi:segregation and condensation protein A
MSGFVVDTGKFQGPVDKLLELIRDRELYINDISLAQVTDGYLKYIARNEETLDNKAEFVQIAATLVLAKSKSLLPNTKDEADNEEVDKLEDRLRAYRLIQQRSRQLRDLFGNQPAFRVSVADQHDQEDMFAPGNTLTIQKLIEAIANCVVELPDESLPTTEIEDTIALKDEIQRLQKHCKEVEQARFSDVTQSDKRHHKVVSFVAVLELAKNGHVTAQQTETFGDIIIKTNHGDER